MAGLYRFSAFLTSLLLVAGTVTPTTPAPTSQRKDSFAMNRAAESYVKLVLAVGQHDTDYVDAYYGPPEWRSDAQAQQLPLAEIAARAAALAGDLAADKPAVTADQMTQDRHTDLARPAGAVSARLVMDFGP